MMPGSLRIKHFPTNNRARAAFTAPQGQALPFTSPHQARAFWNMRNHGEAFKRDGPSCQARGV